jgi:uncharacterized protein
MNQQNILEVPNKSGKYTKKKGIIVYSTILFILTCFGLFVYYTIEFRSKIVIENVKPDEPSFTKNGKLTFIKKGGDLTLKNIDIEIADNDAKRTQGLMWRRSMTDYTGMLFIFDDEEPRSFWMRNTYIPLDIIFVNKSGEIVTIRDDAKPLSEISIQSEKPAQFVVEVNAGFCIHYKVTTGDRIKFEKL